MISASKKVLPLLIVAFILALGTVSSCVRPQPVDNPPVDTPTDKPGDNPGETPGDNPGDDPAPGTNPGSEDTKPDFPENEEQAEESIIITSTIDKSAQEIISTAFAGNQEASPESIASQLDDLEDVQSATVNEEGNIVIKQSDGVYINVLLDTFKEGSKTDISYGSGFSGGLRQSTGIIREKSSVIAGSGKGGKALMLCPLYSEDVADMKNSLGAKKGQEFAESCYANIRQMLEGAGYEVDPWYNGDANFSRFRGSNLSQYDVVVIITHGGRNLTLSDGKTKATGIRTGERIDEGLVPKLNTDFGEALTAAAYKLQKNIENSSVALCMIKGGTYYFITGPGLRAEAPSFNDTWIMLLSCKALADDDLYSAFNDLGAGGVSGFTQTIPKKDGLLLTQNMVALMTSGMEMDDAIAEAKAQDDFGEDLTISNNSKKIFTNKKKTPSKSFYLYDSTPAQIKHEVVNEKAIDLSWEMHPSNALYYYTINVNGNNVYEGRDVPSRDNVFTYTYFPDAPGDYDWKVSATIAPGTEPFVSAVDKFNVAAPAHKAVNLGLSVNWAEQNIGADDPELPGAFYAWGETTPKSAYGWSQYLYGRISYQDKYNKTDGIIQLHLSDDAASVAWGSSWRMPTRTEWAELRDECDWKRTKRNGVSGFEVSGKRGTQYYGNTIFLPDTGYYEGTVHYYPEYGYYWSSSLFPTSSSHAYATACLSSDPSQLTMERNCGLAVRAVSAQGAENYAVLSVYPQSIDFGDVGDSDDISRKQKDFRIINTGKKDAVVSVKHCPEGFVTSINGSVTVPSGSTYYGKITMIADDEERHYGTIEFSTNADTTLKISVSGRHVYDASMVEFSPHELNFNDVVIGSSKTMTVKITNAGKQVGIIYRADMVKEGSSNFTIDLPEYLSLNAGASMEVPVTFAPQTEGQSSARISLCFSDKKKYDTLNLTGKGIQEESGAQLEFSGSEMNFGHVEVGKNDYKILTITNTGQQTATITGISLPDGFQSGFYEKQTIAPKSQGTVTIVFLPKEVRHYSGYVVIKTDTPESGFRLFVEGYGEAEYIAVKSITLDKTRVSMTEGEKLQLNVTFSPENATNKKLKWSSSDESVATVSNSGLVTAVGVGLASIYAETLDGGKTASCFVAVNSNTTGGSHEGTGEENWE